MKLSIRKRLMQWIVELPVLLAGMLIGIYLQAHYPGMFRSWDDGNKILYRGDKVTLHFSQKHASFYRGCEAVFLASQKVTDDEVAWVLLKNCAFQKPNFDFPGQAPMFPPLTTDTFRLRDLDRAK